MSQETSTPEPGPSHPHPMNVFLKLYVEVLGAKQEMSKEDRVYLATLCGLNSQEAVSILDAFVLGNGKALLEQYGVQVARRDYREGGDDYHFNAFAPDILSYRPDDIVRLIQERVETARQQGLLHLPDLVREQVKLLEFPSQLLPAVDEPVGDEVLELVNPTKDLLSDTQTHAARRGGRPLDPMTIAAIDFLKQNRGQPDAQLRAALYQRFPRINVTHMMTTHRSKWDTEAPSTATHDDDSDNSGDTPLPENRPPQEEVKPPRNNPAQRAKISATNFLKSHPTLSIEQMRKYLVTNYSLELTQATREALLAPYKGSEEPPNFVQGNGQTPVRAAEKPIKNVTGEFSTPELYFQQYPDRSVDSAVQLFPNFTFQQLWNIKHPDPTRQGKNTQDSFLG